MSSAISLPSASRAVTMPVAFLDGLRHRVLSAPAESAGIAVDAVRDAGYEAGQALFDQFAAWLTAQGEAAPEVLAEDRFPALCEAFFHAHGWGRVTLAPLSDAVLLLETSDWSEASDATSGCLVSTGLFAGFLSRLADAPLSVLEVDVGAIAPGRCRFLVGSIDVLAYVWEAMQRGVNYEMVVGSA